jgi:hypothetical protein
LLSREFIAIHRPGVGYSISIRREEARERHCAEKRSQLSLISTSVIAAASNGAGWVIRPLGCGLTVDNWLAHGAQVAENILVAGNTRAS